MLNCKIECNINETCNNKHWLYIEQIIIVITNDTKGNIHGFQSNDQKEWFCLIIKSNHILTKTIKIKLKFGLLFCVHLCVLFINYVRLLLCLKHFCVVSKCGAVRVFCTWVFEHNYAMYICTDAIWLWLKTIKTPWSVYNNCTHFQNSACFLFGETKSTCH